jgi:hypothetical protein
MANISANRALPRAVAIASACAEARMLIVAKVSNPTARIVNKTINVSVITKAKAGARMGLSWVFMAESGIGGMIVIHIVLTTGRETNVHIFLPAQSLFSAHRLS